MNVEVPPIEVARTLADEHLPQVRLVFRVIEEIRKYDPELPTQTANTLLYIILHEGTPSCSMAGIAEALNLAQSSVSRNVSALSAVHRNRRPGMGLVETVIDPLERRRRIIRLTRKGREFVRDLEEMMA
jgi:DNA-binding MarR family transcriptional regulator